MIKNWSPELDGLRGYASLWVLLGHICILTQCHIPILSNPGFGVDLFILLSGFLMAKNYIERMQADPWESSNTIKSFWVRRFFRIAPLYYFMLIFAFLLGEHIGYYRDVIASVWPNTQTETSRYTDASFNNIFMHVTFFFGLHPTYAFRTALPDWSIGLEMQYYALFPFIMLLAKKFGFAKISIISMCLCILINYLLPDYFSKFSMPSMIAFKLPLFISGMLIYKASMEKQLSYSIIAMMAPMLTLFSGYFISNFQFIIDELMILGLSVLMTQIKTPSIEKLKNPLAKFLSFKTNQVLGELSYSAYLLHLLIVIPIIGLLIRHTEFENYNGMMRFIISTTIILPLTYILSWILSTFIEKPGISFGKKCIKKK
ncbi:acyltransferase [Kluyvera cryocrescens]|uniref:acyltransferase family protein n=1 Tax=Kluyvera cryocrescens TaxID=580 RepID=UPI0028BF1193|nr:acyltransferase [Kluyvera cryocrescens]WNN73395.1 acyltransferase [Kluyvera cryocrescens]